jgi:Zn finger protein HypA/HybF involved in hydrogenase expression
MRKFNIICENGHENIFETEQTPPIACEKCSVFLDGEILEVNLPECRSILTLKIKYLITGETIDIPVSGKVILGREYTGASVFRRILYDNHWIVSRKHCSIEYKEGQIYLLDEGSLNGTFYGIEKISCRNNPKIMTSGDMFFIGEEAFTIEIEYEKPSTLAQEVPQTTPHSEKAIMHYRCNQPNCGHISDVDIDVCPECHTYKSMITIYV